MGKIGLFDGSDDENTDDGVGSSSYSPLNPGAEFVNAPGFSADNGAMGGSTTTISGGVWSPSNISPNITMSSVFQGVDITNREVIRKLRQRLMDAYEELYEARMAEVERLTEGKWEYDKQ